MRCILLSVLFCAIVISCTPKATIESPDKNVSARIFQDENKSLFYEVVFHGDTVVRKSQLGLIVDGDTLGLNVEMNLLKSPTIREEYTTRGFHTKAINHYHEYVYEVKSGEQKFQLEARVYNDGFAYRYILLEDKTYKINGELSSFACPKNTPVWYFERPNAWKLKTYAGEWLRTLSDSLYRVSPNGPVQGPVLVYELNSGGYMAITEAALYNYSGMRLEAKADASLQANFTENDGFEVSGELTTPWRVIILAKDLTSLVNTDIITNLNPEPDKELFADTSWIKLGRSVWSWWSDPVDFMKPEFEKHMIDRAVELGFEYITIDEGWERWVDKWATLTDLCKYADSKNVGVLVWKHSDQLNFPTEDYGVMRAFFDSVSVAGAKGLKIDFMNGESKELIDFDIRALQLSAERKMVVNFHGCQSPSGEFRSYPNELTREGIRGLELNKMNQPISGNHNVALVFTRCILNNGDYTPIGFSNPASTSWAHQLATGYAFTSPLLTMAEHPDTLFLNPEILPIVPFLKELPSVWDETIVLDGSSISETAILARRKADIWFITILNGNKPKTVDVNLNFLKKGKWTMTSVEDVENTQRKMILKEAEVDANQTISVRLNAEGGYVAKLAKK